MKSAVSAIHKKITNNNWCTTAKNSIFEEEISFILTKEKKMRKGFNLSSFVLNILMIRQYNFAQNF